MNDIFPASVLALESTSEESASERIRIGIEETDAGRIGHMRFVYPERHNIIDLAGWQAIPALLATLVAQSPRLIVLRGVGGRAFVAGADISQFEQAFSGDKAAYYDTATMGAFDALADCPVPTLAAIEGYCIGGGLALASCCDLRLTRADGRFAIPAARLGLAYPPNATLRLVEIIGRAAATDLLFTARQIQADEALSLGLVHRVAADAQFDDALATLIGQISANAPLSLQAAKYVMDNPAASQADINRQLAACLKSDDYKEGRAAFAEKRAPKFIGR